MWEIKELSTSVNFLDLTLKIVHSSVKIKNVTKAMNLYLYIPQTSAHPLGMIKGVIFSLVKNFKHQNLEKTDYIKMVTLLFRRLIARGWSFDYLLTIFIDADKL